MTISAVTLLEHAKLLNDGSPAGAFRAGIISEFANKNPFIARIPFRNIPALAYSYSRESTLPGVAYRGINGSYTPASGVMNPQTETLTICGGELVVDKVLVDAGESREAREAQQLKSLAMTVSKKFIKGDAATSQGKEPDGLQNRILGAQKISNGATSGGDALQLSKLDELLDAVPDADMLVMSKAMRRKFTALMRSATLSGNVNLQKQDVGKPLMFYNDVPIVDIGRDETFIDILGFDEAAEGGGSTATSIYAIRLNEVDGLFGIQLYAPDVTDLGILQTKPQYATRFEWPNGFAILAGDAVGRLYGVSDAAIVA